MRYENMQELLSSLRKFVKENPTAFVEVKDIPTKLCMGFMATKDDGSNESWSISIVNLKKDAEVFTEAERAIMRDYHDACTKYREAEQAYLKVFTQEV